MRGSDDNFGTASGTWKVEGEEAAWEEMPMPVGPQWLGIFVAHMSDTGRLTCRQQQQLTTRQLQMERRRGGEEVDEAGQAGVARAVGKVARQSAWQTEAGHHAGLPQEECVPVDKTCQQPRPPSSSSLSLSIVVLVPGLCCAFVLIHIKMHDEPMNEATLARRRAEADRKREYSRESWMPVPQLPPAGNYSFHSLRCSAILIH